MSPEQQASCLAQTEREAVSSHEAARMVLDEGGRPHRTTLASAGQDRKRFYLRQDVADAYAGAAYKLGLAEASRQTMPLAKMPGAPACGYLGHFRMEEQLEEAQNEAADLRAALSAILALKTAHDVWDSGTCADAFGLAEGALGS